MPRLYLREAEPFLPLDTQAKMEESVQKTMKKGGASAVDEAETTKQHRLSRRQTSLVISDAVVMVIEMLQILALIQSMSLKWSYPESWIKYANFIFIFNMDIWEFMKVHSGAYTRIQGVETGSEEISFSYNFILIGWGAVIFLIVTIFATIYITLRRRQPPYLMVHLAKLELVALFIAQVLALPLGTAVFRLFQCLGNVMAPYNEISCYKGLYWAYLVPAIIAVVFLFGVIPIWMTYRIYQQRLAASSHHHEDYMKLKEVEYMAGLDVVWAVQGFPLFSSFRLPAIYYRPILHTVKLILLIIFSVGSPYIYNQAIAASVILSLGALVVAIVRPFRVTSFNVSLALSLGCLAGDAIFGSVLASVSPAYIESPWLVEPFSYSILIGINVVLGCVLLGWLIYMVAVSYCCRRLFPNDPLWPVLPEYEYEVKGMATYKFMAAVLRGRAILDACMKAPTVFAPVHHLARQIEIVNAYCREAEKTRDGLHLTLLQLVDDMIDVHRRLEPVSLFADTVRENIRQNAARFVELMPAFTRRLAQRDYDLILVNPTKKRLLMKMNIIGMFINGRHERPVRDPVTQDALHKLWDEIPDIIEPKDELEYRVDLYPPPLTGPDTEMLYVAGTVPRPLELMDLEESDEEESLASFLGRVPPTLLPRDSDSRMGSLFSMRTQDLDDKQSRKSSLPQQEEITLENGHTVNVNTEGMTKVEVTKGSQISLTQGQGVTNPAFEPDTDSIKGTRVTVSPAALDDQSPQVDGEDIRGGDERPSSHTSGQSRRESGGDVPAKGEDAPSDTNTATLLDGQDEDHTTTEC